MAFDRKEYVSQVAERIIKQLQEGTAPWLKPWQPGEFEGPFNPVSNRKYNGINVVHLMSYSYADPRWMTFKQAAENGWSVRKGERSAKVEFWDFTARIPKLDENEKPVVDEHGKPVLETVMSGRPKVFHFSVFNAEQIEGVPPHEKKVPEIAWDALDNAEKILADSGANIIHDQRDRAFYRPFTDTIHLTRKASFDAADKYYATALHELGHWTGHETRLGRLRNGDVFGSEGYAREELRAEIASLMVGETLGIGHDPGQHAAYVASWVKVLKEDPLEIFRASSDANKIHNYIMGLDRERNIDKDRSDGVAQEAGKTMETNPPAVPQAVKPKDIRETETPINVPYAERREAGSYRNDLEYKRDLKTWVVKAGSDVSQFTDRWPERDPAQRVRSGKTETADMDPREEFSKRLEERGAAFSPGHPILDGEWHRVSERDGKAGNKNIAYKGFVDGIPNILIENHRTKEKERVYAKGYVITTDDLQRLEQEKIARTEDREAARTAAAAQALQRIEDQLSNMMHPATAPTPYTEAKGIAVHPGTYVNDRTITIEEPGRAKMYVPPKSLCVPAYNVADELRTMQYVNSKGGKFFARGASKHGSFHVVPGGTVAALEKAEVIVLAEGYATAATIHEITGVPVVSVFDSGNLKPVVEQLAERFPGKTMLIAGDDDMHLGRKEGANVGREKAVEAGEAVGADVVFPVFATTEQGGKEYTDFNDLAKRSILGADAAERQINVAIEKARGKKNEIAETLKPRAVDHAQERIGRESTAEMSR